MAKQGRTKQGTASIKVYALDQARKDDFAELVEILVEIIAQNWVGELL